MGGAVAARFGRTIIPLHEMVAGVMESLIGEVPLEGHAGGRRGDFKRGAKNKTGR